MGHCDWADNGTALRVAKKIEADRVDDSASVVASTATKPDEAYAEIARLVRQLIDAGKVADPNQIAFLFPSLKSDNVSRARKALEAVGLRSYAPRAGRFLEVDEAIDVFGVFVKVFGKAERGDFPGRDYNDF